MATRTVLYSNTSLLQCAGCAPADVILCVPSNKVAEPACPAGMASSVPNETVERSYISASLVATAKAANQCGGYIYTYTFTYDDAQLVPGEQINTSDIQGVLCRDCATQWVEDLVGNDVRIAGDSNGLVTFTTQHGCIYQLQNAYKLTPVLGGIINVVGSMSGLGTVSANEFNPNVRPADSTHKGNSVWDFTFAGTTSIPAPPFALAAGWEWAVVLTTRGGWETAQGTLLTEPSRLVVRQALLVNGSALDWNGVTILTEQSSSIGIADGNTQANYGVARISETFMYRINQASITTVSMQFQVLMPITTDLVRPNITYGNTNVGYTYIPVQV